MLELKSSVFNGSLSMAGTNITMMGKQTNKVVVLILVAISSMANAQTDGVFKDCPDCPEMVVIPAGSFMMGSPGGEV